MGALCPQSENGDLGIDKLTTEMSASNREDRQCEEQVTAEKSCFCFKSQKPLKKKINVQWQVRFLNTCKQLEDDFPWAARLIDLVKLNQLNKVKYYREIQSLREEKPVSDFPVQASASTPEQVQRFKKNLKKSVIISFHSSRLLPELQSSIMKSNLSQKKNSRQDLRGSRRVQYPGSLVYMRKNSRSNSGNSIKQKSSTSSVRRSSSSKITSEKDVSKQTVVELDIFLKFSNILERHMADNGCILGRIRKLFVEYFQQQYRNVERASTSIEFVIASVQQFLNLLKETVMDYYNLSVFSRGEENGNSFISNEENILSSCTAILFRDHAFYSCLFNLIVHHHKDRQAQFARILNHLKGRGPQSFMVKHKFCLNALTMKSYIKSLGGDSGGTQNVVQNIEINDIVTEHADPYRACMNNLSEIAKFRSPVNKLKSIMACSEGITQQIEKFYDVNGLKKQKWMLDADQVLSIFCYLIVGARVDHLHTHIFILDHFATSHQMMSMTGYYLSVIRGAVEQLQNEFAESVQMGDI